MTTLAVFFPSLMGFGILVSGVLLISDAVHRLLPNQGRRRRLRLASGAHAVVARAAGAAGRSVDAPGFLTRTYHSRSFYLLLTVLSATAIAAVVGSGTAVYRDVKGVFYESPWIQGLTIAAAVALGAFGLLTLVLTVAHSRSPQPLRRLVGTTPLGRIQLRVSGSKGEDR